MILWFVEVVLLLVRYSCWLILFHLRLEPLLELFQMKMEVAKTLSEDLC